MEREKAFSMKNIYLTIYDLLKDNIKKDFYYNVNIRNKLSVVEQKAWDKLSLDEDCSNTFWLMIDMELRNAILNLSKALSKDSIVKNLEVSSINEIQENINTIKDYIYNDVLYFSLFKDNNDETNYHFKSSNFLNDFLFLDTDKFFELKERILDKSDVIEPEYFDNIKKLSIQLNGSYQKLNNKYPEVINLLIGNSTREVFLKSIIKIKSISVLSESESIKNLNGLDFIEEFNKSVFKQIKSNGALAGYDSIKKIIKKFNVVLLENYLNETITDEKRKEYVEFLVKNKKNLTKGYMTDYKNLFVEHWENILVSKNKKANDLFQNIYNEEIKKIAKKNLVIKDFLNGNLKKEIVFSKSAVYRFEDINMLFDNFNVDSFNHQKGEYIFSSKIIEGRKRSGDEHKILLSISSKKELPNTFDMSDYINELYAMASKRTSENINDFLEPTLRKMLLQNKLEEHDKENYVKKETRSKNKI